MTPEEVLLKAVDIIERDGWHQGAAFAGPTPIDAPHDEYMKAARTAPVCAMGAISRAVCGDASLTPHTPEARSLYHQAAQLLAQNVPGNHIAWWNDQPSTTKEDVVLMMKRVANHDA